MEEYISFNLIKYWTGGNEFGLEKMDSIWIWWSWIHWLWKLDQWSWCLRWWWEPEKQARRWWPRAHMRGTWWGLWLVIACRMGWKSLKLSTLEAPCEAFRFLLLVCRNTSSSSHSQPPFASTSSCQKFYPFNQYVYVTDHLFLKSVQKANY